MNNIIGIHGRWQESSHDSSVFGFNYCSDQAMDNEKHAKLFFTETRRSLDFMLIAFQARNWYSFILLSVLLMRKFLNAEFLLLFVVNKMID